MGYPQWRGRRGEEEGRGGAGKERAKECLLEPPGAAPPSDVGGDARLSRGLHIQCNARHDNYPVNTSMPCLCLRLFSRFCPLASADRNRQSTGNSWRFQLPSRHGFHHIPSTSASTSPNHLDFEKIHQKSISIGRPRSGRLVTASGRCWYTNESTRATIRGSGGRKQVLAKPCTPRFLCKGDYLRFQYRPRYRHKSGRPRLATRCVP